MKYYYYEVITEYDGLQFLDKAIVQFEKAPTVADWNKQIEDFTHDGAEEDVYLAREREITKEDFDVLKKYL